MLRLLPRLLLGSFLWLLLRLINNRSGATMPNIAEHCQALPSIFKHSEAFLRINEYCLVLLSIDESITIND